MELIEVKSRDDFKRYIVDLFVRFQNICKKNNFKYFLAYGSLLGAVRHKGFIPWDDDLDVFMPRKDYNKLIEHFKTNSYEHLQLFHPTTNKNYIYAIIRINDDRFVSEEPLARKKYGLGICFDIYPLDGVNINDKRFIKKMKNRYRVARDIYLKRFAPSNSFLKNLVKFPLFLMHRFLNVNKYMRKTDELSMKYDFYKEEYCFVGAWVVKNIYKTSDFSDTLEVEFENIKSPIPIGYDSILKTMYGNYMQFPPVEKRIPYHYERVFIKK